MNDYSNIEKYPIGEWDIGLWFDVSYYMTNRNILVGMTAPLVNYDVDKNVFEIETPSSMLIVVEKKRIESIKRLSPQPKFKSRCNQLCFYLDMDGYLDLKPRQDYIKPFNIIYLPFNDWIHEHTFKQIKKECPFWLDEDFWSKE